MGVGGGQGGLVCCDSWGRKESDMTERLNWTEEKRKAKGKINWTKCWFSLELIMFVDDGEYQAVFTKAVLTKADLMVAYMMWSVYTDKVDWTLTNGNHLQSLLKLQVPRFHPCIGTASFCFLPSPRWIWCTVWFGRHVLRPNSLL